MSLSVQQPSAITVDVFAEAWCHLCTLTIDDNDDDSDDDDNDDDDDDDYCMLLLLWANKYFAKNIMIDVKALHQFSTRMYLCEKGIITLKFPGCQRFSLRAF